jgi:hypothetical protein
VSFPVPFLASHVRQRCFGLHQSRFRELRIRAGFRAEFKTELDKPPCKFEPLADIVDCERLPAF